MNSDPLIAAESQPFATAAAIVRADERLTLELSNIRIPALIIHGTADKAAKPSGSPHLYERAGAEDKTLKLYEGRYHDPLNDIGKEEVMSDILSWVAQGNSHMSGVRERALNRRLAEGSRHFLLRRVHRPDTELRTQRGYGARDAAQSDAQRRPAMTTANTALEPQEHVSLDHKLAKGPGRWALLPAGIVLVVGLSYVIMQLLRDLGSVPKSVSLMPYVLLGIALLVALAFEFVNGFHDTANAVATVIYTHSLDPHVAVIWSGLWNFIGVLVSTGTVAFGIVSLLPVELILQVGGGAGFAKVFALLTAAIIWNLGTWYFGLPSSSSHTLIGSVLGVGIANQWMAVKTGTSGVDWGQALNVGKSLFFSPVIGFVAAALLLMLLRKVVPDKRLYEAPHGSAPPPFWIRCLLVLTCTV